MRRELERFRGREVDTAGDGFFAAFDGPARAIRCAVAIGDVVGGLGLEVRAGLECGVLLADTNDIKAGDMLEVFEVEERARTL